MVCKNCGVENDPGSKFCKECGQRLEEEPVKEEKSSQDEHVRIGELIYTAYKHKEAGRLEDAILACHGALALNEASASAHALLGELYEKRGDKKAAIREYERVLEISPESSGTQKKLDDLKLGKVSQDFYFEPEPMPAKWKQNLPFIIACGAFLIVIAFGMYLMKPSQGIQKTKYEAPAQPTSTQPIYGNLPQNQPEAPDTANPNGVNGQPYTNSLPNANQPVAQPPQPAQNTNQNTNPAPPQAPVQPPKQNQPRPRPQQQPRPAPAPSSLTIRPMPSPNNGSNDETPVIVPVITEVKPTPTRNTSRSSSSNSVAPAPAVDPEVKALKLQQAGKYQDAIDAYNDGLSKSGDKGRVYQSIGFCYYKLGQKDLAVTNYNHAISAYRAQISAGGNASDIQRNIRACEAGIQVNK